MKKVLFAIAAVITFAACNNSSEGAATTVDSTAVDSTVAIDTTAATVDTIASIPAVEAK
jgi:uncharacterized lipoprotein NlpE involved in copper resistance